MRKFQRCDVHNQYSIDIVYLKMWAEVNFIVSLTHTRTTTKGQAEIIGGDEYIYYFDCDDGKNGYIHMSKLRNVHELVCSLFAYQSIFTKLEG